MQRILDIDLIINPILPWIGNEQRHTVIHQYKYSYNDYISKEKRHKLGTPIACGAIKRVLDPENQTIRRWFGRSDNGTTIGPVGSKEAIAHLVAEITINGDTYAGMRDKQERKQAESAKDLQRS